MEVGVIKIAEDSDFRRLKWLVDNHDGWKLDYECLCDEIKVWSKTTSSTPLKMVKVHAVFSDVSANTMFDVLHDPDYRKEWDEHMLISIDVGFLNPNNDVGYYAISCPTPVKNRDFVLQRSWLDLSDEKLIINHSVHHKDYAPRKGFIRGTTYLTGYVVRKHGSGCFLGYISQTDPKGKLPSWIVNKMSQKFAPKVVTQLKKAATGYESWKASQSNPGHKPWIYPEFTLNARISISDCIEATHSKHEIETDDENLDNS